MNRFIGIGRITKDIELKYTNSNIAFTKFTLAINRTFGDKETDFIQCVAWKQVAENTVKYCHKGSLIGIDGRIQTGSYDNKDGVRVYTTEIMCDNVQFLDSKSDTPPPHEVYEDVKRELERPDTLDVSNSDLPF